LGAVAVAVGLVVAVPAGALAHARTARVIVAGNVTPAVGHATRIGLLPGSQRLLLYVSLPLRDLADLQARVGGLGNPLSPYYRHSLSAGQITARYGPTPMQLATVESYLRASGVRITSVNAQRSSINAVATVSVVERAFGVRIWRWRDSATGRVFYANPSEPVLPMPVGRLVQSIAGLENYGQLTPATVTCTTTPPGGPPSGTCAEPAGVGNQGYTPSQLQKAYTVDQFLNGESCAPALKCDGEGQTIGLFEFGTSWDPNNERAYDQQYGLSPPASSSVCYPASPCPLANDPGAQSEADLDVEVVHAIAPRAQVVVLETPDGSSIPLSGLGNLLDAALNKVSGSMIGSISYGECESDFPAATPDSLHAKFMTLLANNKPVFAASGDHGAACPSFPGGVLAQGVLYPASDPAVTTVGGTNVFLNSDGSYAFEYAWSGSGGNVSKHFSRPAWQTPCAATSPPQCEPNLPSPTTYPGRLVPDVAAEAAEVDPTSTMDYGIDGMYPSAALGYSIFTIGGPCGSACWQPVGGTSAATPLWASLVAMYNQYATANGKVALEGNVNEQLYNLAARDHRYAGAITDITYGPKDSSQLFPNPNGWTGYDFATGTGTPELYPMAQDLPGLAITPTSGPSGTPVAVTGTSFLPGEQITATNAGTGAQLCTGTAASDGSFSCFATVTASQPISPRTDRVNVVASGQTSAEESVSTFTLTPRGTASPSWAIQYVPNPSGAVQPALNGVSCASATACTAVGFDSATRDAVVERSNGADWTVQPTPTPSGGALTGVACPNASTCIAVGASSSGALAERWNGSTWTIQPTPTGSGLDAVACATATDCTAVGDSSGTPLAMRWNGTNWKITPTAPPTGWPDSQLVGVSCTSPNSCFAVGAYGLFTDQIYFPLVEHWNGSAWEIQPTPSGNGLMWLVGVSCASPSACMAVGDLGLAERWNGTAWTMQSTANVPAIFGGVSCPSASACIAVGSTINGSNNPTLAEQWNGIKWSVQTTPSFPLENNNLDAVSCASTLACTAVGAYAGNNGSPFGMLAEGYS
jgi:kumamolisin